MLRRFVASLVLAPILALLLGLSLPATLAQAGVFNLPHFITSGFGLGLEPELTLTNGAGVGINAHYTQNLNELMNITGILGTSGGPRGIRAGANTTFDFFPDIEGQPGIGLGVQGIYYRLSTNKGLFEVTAIPYIHKTFLSGKSEIEPFLAIPFGMGFSEGRYNAVSSLSVGSMFKNSESLRYIIEFGIAVNNAESFISGGVVYYH